MPFPMKQVFAALGRPSFYTSPAGETTACRAIQATKELFYGGISLPIEGLCLDLLRSDVTPEVGGSFSLGSTSYPIDIPPLPFPADQDTEGLRWRLLLGWGSPVSYRTPTGNQNTLNPPTGSGWTLSAAASAGATAISIKATLTTGRLLAGDQVMIGGAAYTIAAPVTAAANTFANVSLTAPLAAAATAGTPVSFLFACDRPIKAAVRAFQAEQLLGGIVVGDQRLVIPHAVLDAAGVPQEPSAADSVLIGATRWKVKTAVAARQAGEPVLWQLTVGA